MSTKHSACSVHTGECMGRFLIGEKLEDSLQGAVYDATDLFTRKRCVVKIACASLVSQKLNHAKQPSREDFKQERELVTANLIPGGIVEGIAAWDIFDDSGNVTEHCYAMEYCDCDLLDYVNDCQIRSMGRDAYGVWARTVADLFSQLCDTVHRMHQLGLCHLDLSLENAMIVDTDKNPMRVKIIDLGTAQCFQNGNLRHRARVGKNANMAPEVFLGKPYDVRAADVFSLGTMLYTMLVGDRQPYLKGEEVRSWEAFHSFVTTDMREVLRGCRLPATSIDLLNKMLCYEDERISLDEVLCHPFVQGSRSTPMRMSAAPRREDAMEQKQADAVQHAVRHGHWRKQTRSPTTNHFPGRGHLRPAYNAFGQAPLAMHDQQMHAAYMMPRQMQKPAHAVSPSSSVSSMAPHRPLLNQTFAHQVQDVRQYVTPQNGYGDQQIREHYAYDVERGTGPSSYGQHVQQNYEYTGNYGGAYPTNRCR